MALNYFAPANYFVVGDATVVASWSAGDDIFVFGFTGNGSDLQNTPTATGLTFSLIGSYIGGAGTETNIYLWRATAASAGTSVTITSTRNGHTNPCGITAHVEVGGASSVTVLTGAGNEAAYAGVSTGAGNDVLFGACGFSGTTPATTPLTGSGTVTERADIGNTTDYGVYVCDWQLVSAGSFSFGLTSYANMGQTSQVGVVIVPNIVPQLSQSHFRFGADDGSESAHTFIGAEDTNVNLSISDARLLRVQVDETAGAATTLYRPTWQYKQVGDPDSEYRDIKP